MLRAQFWACATEWLVRARATLGIAVSVAGNGDRVAADAMVSEAVLFAWDNQITVPGACRHGCKWS